MSSPAGRASKDSYQGWGRRARMLSGKTESPLRLTRRELRKEIHRLLAGQECALHRHSFSEGKREDRFRGVLYVFKHLIKGFLGPESDLRLHLYLVLISLQCFQDVLEPYLFHVLADLGRAERVELL